MEEMVEEGNVDVEDGGEGEKENGEEEVEADEPFLNIPLDVSGI